MVDPVTATIATWDIVQIALGSGAIAALVGGAFQWVKDFTTENRIERNNGRIDAIHLITKLDVLAMNCAKNYWQFTEAMDEYKSSRWGDNCYPSCTRPVISIDQAELSRIDQKIAAQIAWLENEFSLGKEMILIKMDLSADPPDIQDEYANLVGHYGFRVLELAETLRRKYNIRGDELILKLKDQLIDDTLEQASLKVRKFLSAMN